MTSECQPLGRMADCVVNQETFAVTLAQGVHAREIASPPASRRPHAAMRIPSATTPGPNSLKRDVAVKFDIYLEPRNLQRHFRGE